MKTKTKTAVAFHAKTLHGYLENGLPLTRIEALNVVRKAGPSRSTLKRANPCKYCSLRR